jgi:hypothetical protein
VLRPRIKNVHRVIGLVPYGVASGIGDDENHTIEALVRLMDGTRYFEDICAGLARTHPGIDPNTVRDVINDLTDAGFVEDGTPWSGPKHG